jgi:type II secretory pathway pseudopilin PulG
MHILPCSLKISLASHRKQPVSGFSLVEILVATVILLAATAGITSAINFSNRSTLLTEASSRDSAAIDTNISEILGLAERFTCCSGTCTSDAAAIAAAGAKCTGVFGDANYYFTGSNLADQTDLSNFLTRCQAASTASDLVTPLISQITASVPAPNGIARTIAPDPDLPASTHTIRVIYTGNNINRVVKVVPTVAVWCP